MRTPLLFSIALAPFLASTADAADVTRHGLTCKPVRGSEARIEYTSWGAGNYSATDRAAVFCPLADWFWAVEGHQNGDNERVYSSVTGLDEVTVYALDTSSTSPLFCQLVSSHLYGGSWWGPRRYTSSVQGGSPDETSSYTGYANLRLADPYAVSTQTDPRQMANIYCSLPPAAPDGSWIKGFVSTTIF